jgi:hypothetical protein
MTFDELDKALTINLGGKLAEKLEELEQCSFIRSYTALGKVKKDTRYQLIDNFTLFHFKFIAEANKGSRTRWTTMIGTPEYRAWSGLAFERVCLLHEDQILKALGISGMECGIYSWTYRPQNDKEKGAQIDMLIDRRDGVINVCEVKFVTGEFPIGAKYARELENKLSVLKEETQTDKSLHLTMITASGIKRNEYSYLVHSQVRLDDLFRI